MNNNSAKKNEQWRLDGAEITLRDYQINCLNAINNGLKKYNSVLAQLPTGAGKTVIFNTFALKNTGRTLVIVHRNELLSQTVEKYAQVGGKEEDAKFIKAGDVKIGNLLTVAMIQTLYGQLNKINPRLFSAVIIDEAHHSAASTWKAVITKFQDAGIKIIGVTATPFRTDKQDLKEIYNELVFKFEITDLIAMGFLCPIVGKTIEIPADFSNLKTKKDKETGGADFTKSSLNKVLNQETINTAVADKWLNFGENRKTIFFTVSIKHAENLHNEFVKRGVNSAVISSRLKLEDRNKIINDFKDGNLKVLVNVDILTEGFDDPSVECICLLRPTKSLSLYAQIIGRGLRPSPATKKKDCLILDFTGKNKDMFIVGLGELFDLPQELKEHIDKEGISIGSVETEEFEEDENGELKQKRELKLLIGNNTKEFSFESKEAMEYATKIGKDEYVLTCGQNGKVLTMKKEGKYNFIYLNDKQIKKNLHDSYAWMVFTTVWKYYKDDWAEDFAKRAKGEPVTQKQIDILKAARAKNFISGDMPTTKIAATNLISSLFSDKSKANALFNRQNGINYISGGDFTSEYRYEFKGVKINIAHAFLLHFKFGIPAPRWVEDLKKNVKDLKSLSNIDLSGLKNKTDIEVIDYMIKQGKFKPVKNDKFKIAGDGVEIYSKSNTPLLPIDNGYQYNKKL